MKMRKLVAALLAVLMLCSIIPFSAAAASASATITFDSVSKRTEFDTSHQVWQENGITVTNKKDASTSNVADYAKPARFYKNSTLVVEYPGMTKIEFTCNTAAYATALQGAIADATVDGNVVSVSLNGVDSFSCVLSGGQVRVDSITVYGEGGAPVVPPVEPDEPEEPDVPVTPEEPDEPVVPADSAMLDLTDKANRVSYSSSQQVWKQNGIVVTNDKGSSTSNVGDYANPGRFYKSSTVTIEYPGMTKIVIDSVTYADNDYAIGWTNSFSGDATATVVDGDVTIVLAQPADTFVWEQLTSQSRAYTITVYTGDAGDTPDVPDVPDVPEVPSDDPESDTELTIAEAIALGASKEHNTYTTGSYYVTGVITEVYNTQWGNMYITDGEGNTLTIYGTYSADGELRYDAMDVKPVAGDTVTIYGVVGQYNGKPQIKNGWIVAHTAAGGETPDVPDVPVDPPVSDEIETDYPFLFGMTQYNVSEEDIYFLAGGMAQTYYLATTTNPDEAIVVYVEATEGGYYFYTYDGDTKLYINMVVSDDGKHVNGAYETTAATVYRYDAEYVTLIANVNGDDYWFGTRNDKTYTTVGPCKVEYEGFYCEFYSFSEEGECDHDYEIIEEMAPTCGEDGMTIYACTICGEEFAEPIPATGDHVYDDEYDADCNVCGAIRQVPEKPVEYAGNIVVSTEEAAAGDTIQVSVSLSANPGIVSTKVKVYFDNTVLKFVAAEAGDFSAGGYSWSDPNLVQDKGYVVINWCDAINPDSVALLLATLTFEVMEGTEDGFYALYPEFNCDADIFNAADETVYFEAVSGGVQVVTQPAFEAGDADGNGKVNNRDLGLLKKYLNNDDLSDKTFIAAAIDLDGNGKINNRDLGLLKKMLNNN